MFSTSPGERSRSPRRARTRKVALTGLSAAALVIGFSLPAAFAAGPGFHELEGNILDNTTADPPYDWSDIFTDGSATAEPTVKAGLPSSILDPDFTRDFRTTAAGAYVNGDLSYFATGSKDTLDINPGWQCKKTNNATDKGDWVNAYGYAARVDHDSNSATDDHTVFFFGLEKDDDNGTNNVGIWLLQDEDVACETSGGGNVPFAGQHVDGDLLAVVAYDSGGTVGTAQGYVWNAGLPNTPSFNQTQAECDPNNITYANKFCVITNSGGTIDSPWWSPQKVDKSLDAQLQKNTFVEGFLDVTAIYAGLNRPAPCFATSIANSRASTSTTAALYDFVEIEAATCGPLTLQKYFDRNADGTKQATEPFLQGWEFKVFADGANPATATPLYTGYTDATGTVSFAEVPTGNYDVYETGKVKLADGTIVNATEYWASDPVGTYPVKYDLTQTVAGSTVDFGNACFVDKSFEVTNVPAGAVLALTYAINDPDDNGPSTTVDMVANGTSRTYTLGNTLKPADTVDWSYAYKSGTPAGSIAVEDDETMAGFTDTSGIGLTCAKPNTTAFPLATLSGTKYKDADADGTKDATDAGIDGFEFKLYSGSTGATGTALQTTTSAANGTYSFTNVAPGSYSVVETAKAGWQQTAPTAPSYRTVTVALGVTSVSIGDFLNAPLTDLSVTVDPQTNFTFADSISCVKTGGGAAGTPVDGVLPADAGLTKTLTANNLLVGTYTCTIVITDP
ncbi:MAG: SdrD B-like domain-containing protein [Knoellia sp.]